MVTLWIAARILLAAIVVVAVAEVSKRQPRYGAVLLSLPIVSMLSFLFSWFQHRDLPAISKLARETLMLVPLGLPFFVPFAFADRLGMSFWTCFATGATLGTVTIMTWFACFPLK